MTIKSLVEVRGRLLGMVLSKLTPALPKSCVERAWRSVLNAGSYEHWNAYLKEHNK